MRSRSAWLRVAIALLATILLVALTSRSRSAPPPNIVLIVVDTLRADALGCYGSPDGLTPNIDRLAAGGVRFDRVVAQASWTAPSVASILSSRYPSEHGEGARRIALGVDPVSLAEILGRRGYRTAAFVEVEWPYLRRGFQTFDNTIPDYTDRLKAERRGAPVTFARASNWIAAHRDRPFFVLIYTVEVHDYFVAKDYARQFAVQRLPAYDGPFRRWSNRDLSGDPGSRIIHTLLTASPEDMRFVRALYDAGVRTVDDTVGTFTGSLAHAGLQQDTVIAITADHGEGFDAADKRVHHGGRLHDDLLRVPFVLAWASHLAPAVVRSQVRSIDIAPTLLRFSTPNKDPHFRGEAAVESEPSRLAWPDAGQYRARVPEDRPALAEESALAVLPSGERIAADRYQMAISIGGSKLIHAPDHEELYDLDADPQEHNNVIDHHATEAAALRKDLARMALPLNAVKKANASKDLSDVLRSLGYIR